MQAALPAEVLRRVFLRDAAVHARVPLVVVDPVQDPRQVRAAPAQDPVEAESVLRALDLARVLWRHGVHELREGDAPLQVADRPVELERLGRAQVPRQAQDADRVAIEHALVGHVVDREHARDAAQRGIAPVEGLQVDGDETGLPVVGMEDVRPLPAAAEVLQGRAREEREAQAVVGVVPVDRGPVVEGRVLDEDDLDSGFIPCSVEAGASGHGIDGHVDRSRELAGREGNGRIAREEDGHAVTELHQRLGQRRGDVGEAPCFHVGDHLRGHESDV